MKAGRSDVEMNPLPDIADQSRECRLPAVGLDGGDATDDFIHGMDPAL